MPPRGLGPHNPHKGAPLGREKRGDPEHMTLSERRQTHKATRRVTPRTRNVQNTRVRREEAGEWLSGGWGGAGRVSCSSGRASGIK